MIGGGQLTQAALKFFRDPKFKDVNHEKPKEISAAEQAAKLVPKVIPVDQEGKPLCEVEAVPLAVKTPEIAVDLPWADWTTSAWKPSNINEIQAKAVFRGACMLANRQTATEMPIALQRCGTIVQWQLRILKWVNLSFLFFCSGEMLPCSFSQIHSLALTRKLRAWFAGQESQPQMR